MTALSDADRLVVREHNWFAAQTAKTAQLFHQLGLLFGIENPARREGVPSLFELEEIKALQSLQGVQFKRFPQCAFGSPFQKYTEILGSLNLDSWASECTCKPQWWAIPWSGEAFHAPHPPLKGRQLAVPWNEWSPGMLRQAELGGSYLTKATAHYPSLMNESLARALTCDSASMSVPLSKLPDSFPIEDLASSTEVKKRTSLDSQDLSRKSQKTQQGSALGGLRNTWRSVPRVPASINLGVQIRNLLDAKLNENPDVQEQLLGSIGTPLDALLLPTDWINSVRLEVALLIKRVCGWEHPEGDVLSEINASVNTETCKSPLKAEFWSLWTEAVNDPAKHLVQWIRSGAPAGILSHPELDGVCEQAESEDESVEPEILCTDFSSFQNFSGVERNPAVCEAIQEFGA